MNPELEEKTLEHAKAAYANAQETIRFIDTKAGALTGLLTIATGLPMWILQWLTEQQAEEKSIWHFGIADCHPFLITSVFMLWGCGVIAGVISLWLILDCILARLPSKKRKAVTLFPIIGDRHSCHVIARRLTEGLTRKDVIGEYRTQILRVGFILTKKTKKLGRAMVWFRLQIAAYGLGTLGLMKIYLTQMK